MASISSKSTDITIAFNTVRQEKNGCVSGHLTDPIIFYTDLLVSNAKIIWDELCLQIQNLRLKRIEELFYLPFFDQVTENMTNIFWPNTLHSKIHVKYMPFVNFHHRETFRVSFCFLCPLS